MEVSRKTKLTLVSMGYFEVITMHLIYMHNNILPEFSVILIGITLLFSDLGVLPQTLESRIIELPLLSQASSFLHILIGIFCKNYFQKLLSLHLKKKNYFRMMWSDIYIVWWAMEPWMVRISWWRFHRTESKYLGINHPSSSDPSAVLKYRPTNSLWMG